MRTKSFVELTIGFAAVLVLVVGQLGFAATTTVVFSDDFNRSPDRAWTFHNRFGSVRNGALHIDGGYRPDPVERSGWATTHVGDRSWTNYTLSVVYDTTNASGLPTPDVHYGSFLFRVQNALSGQQTYYEVGIWAKGSGDPTGVGKCGRYPLPTGIVGSSKFVNGRGVVLDERCDSNAVIGRNTVTIVVNGSMIVVISNGRQVLAVTDPGVPLTYGGVGLFAVWESHGIFDNVRVVGPGETSVGTTLTGYRVIGSDGAARAGDPDGYGGATLTVTRDLAAASSRLCYRLSATRTALPGTSAQVRRAVIGRNGPVVAELGAPPDGGQASGCVDIPTASAIDLAGQPGNYYVTAANDAYPSGSLRGNLDHTDREGLLFATSLVPVDDDDGGPAGAVGSSSVTVNGRTFCYEAAARGITNATAAHLHAGVAGTDGPVVVALARPRRDGSTAGCTSIDPNLVGDIAAHPDRYYVDVHTTTEPTGVIRGNLVRVP